MNMIDVRSLVPLNEDLMVMLMKFILG